MGDQAAEMHTKAATTQSAKSSADQILLACLYLQSTCKPSRQDPCLEDNERQRRMMEPTFDSQRLCTMRYSLYHDQHVQKAYDGMMRVKSRQNVKTYDEHVQPRVRHRPKDTILMIRIFFSKLAGNPQAEARPQANVR